MNTAHSTTGMHLRSFEYKGRKVCVSGASTACLVWIDDKVMNGMIDCRYKSLRDARAAARSYIDRHAQVVA